jgi:hypothetical protein
VTHRKEAAAVQPEPPTLGGVILDDVVRFIRRFVVLSETQADAVALWVAHTHAIDAADTTPYLTITSPEKRCGKSRLLLDVFPPLIRNPLPSASISDAALFRAIENNKPTFLLDEVDAVFGSKAREREELRGLLNAGYRRGLKAHRMGGSNNRTLEAFEVFCPKAFAGIGDSLPDTITDRAIAIRLQRRLPEETIERFRQRLVAPEAEELRDRIADWLEPQLAELRGDWPELPDELDDRAQDVWEPLFAIADLAGGDWPERARRSAVALSGPEAKADAEESKTALLLRDIRIVFETSEEERIRTADLIEHLSAIEESPWGDWFGKPISPQALSKLLRPYRIRTMPIWLEGAKAHGYKREQFEDAWLRVLGGRDGRDGRSGLAPDLAPTAPTVPTVQGGESVLDAVLPPPKPNGILVVGDPMYPVLLAEAGNNGHVTEDEFSRRLAIHKVLELPPELPF